VVAQAVKEPKRNSGPVSKVPTSGPRPLHLVGAQGHFTLRRRRTHALLTITVYGHLCSHEVVADLKETPAFGPALYAVLLGGLTLYENAIKDKSLGRLLGTLRHATYLCHDEGDTNLPCSITPLKNCLEQRFRNLGLRS
jgi:hypothetical protein